MFSWLSLSLSLPAASGPAPVLTTAVFLTHVEPPPLSSMLASGMLLCLVARDFVPVLLEPYFVMPVGLYNEPSSVGMKWRRKALRAGAPAMKIAVLSSMQDQYRGTTTLMVGLELARRSLREERRTTPATVALRVVSKGEVWSGGGVIGLGFYAAPM